MALCNIGKTILDEARLCYVADDFLRNELSSIKYYRQEDGFCLLRTKRDFFRHCFTVYWGEYETRTKPIAQIYFSHTGNTLESENEQQEDYIFFRLENRILYQPEDEIRKVLTIPTLYGMLFHHFTRLDFAKDFKKNIVNVINRLMKRTDIGTIINQTWEDNHKKILNTLKEFRDRTLDRAINPELIVMQANAVKNKNNGIIVSAYNKLAEIRNKYSYDGYKQYILDYYGCPKKSLHRLEVRVNGQSITNYCNNEEHYVPMTEEILFDNTLLTNMYFEFLGRVLRFTRVSTSRNGKRTLRKPIPWQEVLCNNKL